MSSYFTPRGLSSNGYQAPSLPVHILATPNTNGYESDSSDERPRPQPLLGLRVVNPDEQDSIVNEKEDTTVFASSSLDMPSNETITTLPSPDKWKAYPIDVNTSNTTTNVLGLHAQPIVRRESKTATVQSESCETAVPTDEEENVMPSPTVAVPTMASKYTKVSYHLTNNPEGLKQYRTMAEKSNSLDTQLAFAKYLLESANAFSQAEEDHKKVIGSMWGMNCTTNKKSRPEPLLIIPPPSASAYCSSSSSSARTRSEFNSMSHIIPARRQTSVRSSNDTNELKKRKLEQEGIDWIIRLAKKNVPEACYIQANWIDKEMHGFKKNKLKAIGLHQIASDGKIPESMFAIAEYYEQERNGLDAKSIVELYREASEFGYVNAIYRLAILTIHGQLGLRQSLTEGLKLMCKACTFASYEFNEPLYTYAMILTNEYKSVDFPSSILEQHGGKRYAISYYEQAALLGHSGAQARLGFIYEHGLYDAPMNFAIAFDYYQQAATMHNNPKAMLGLCRLYNRGIHGPEDKDEQRRLELDVSGWLANTAADEDASFAWCEKAAKAGNHEALLLLGWFYEIGFGVPRDFSRAKVYYQSAADRGNQEAKKKLLNTHRSMTQHQHEVIQSSVKKKKTKVVEKKQNGCRCM